MGLPLYLAMTASEVARAASLPPHMGWFSPEGGGALPGSLPPGALLILTDRSPLPITDGWVQTVRALDCGGVLLDFERPPTENAKALAEALPCPVAAPPGYLDDPGCAVFLPPCPLHVPLADYLRPWRQREVWLDVTARQQTVTVTAEGPAFGPVAAADRQGGTFDEALCCQVITQLSDDTVRFTLFDTADTLKQKLAQAKALGVTRAVGLYQELHGCEL